MSFYIDHDNDGDDINDDNVDNDGNSRNYDDYNYDNDATSMLSDIK